MYMDRQRIGSFIKEYVTTQLPVESGVTIKTTTTSNLQVTMYWGGRQASCFVVCGPSGYNLEYIKNQLDYLKTVIPGLIEEYAKEQGYREATIEEGLPLPEKMMESMEKLLILIEKKFLKKPDATC